MPDQQNKLVYWQGQNGKLQLNDEGKVYHYFLNKNYNIILGRMVSTEKGIPDLMINIPNGNRLFVEVKNNKSTLSINQILWVANNNEEKTLLAIVNGKKIKFYDMKIKEVNLDEK